MGEAREPESGGFVSRGPQPRGGDPSGADQSLPEPAHAPRGPARRPNSSEPEPPGPGQHPLDPEDSPRVRRATENSTQPEREEETGPEQVQTRRHGSELDRRGPEDPNTQAVH